MGLGHAHHGHDHAGTTQPEKSSGGGMSAESVTALRRALILTLAFMVIEFFGGYVANSLALISDAVHMLMDAGALTLSLLVAWISKRQAPRGYTYGYQRVEILGALFNGLLIWLISGLLVFESIERFRAPPTVRGEWVFWIATIGLAANLVSLFFLHRSSRENLNVKSAYLHLISDSVGSVGAMIAGAVVALTGWQLVDPIITVFLAVLMLWGSWSLVREAVGILLEKSPTSVRLEEIESALGGIEGVQGIHDLHVWTLSSGTVALSVHLVSAAGRDSNALLHEAVHLLGEDFSIRHTTIQVEAVGSDLSDHCESCGTRSPGADP